jgi:hypothetical protein
MTNTDYISSRIVGIIGGIIFFLSVGVHFASADITSYSRTPSGNGTYQTMHVDIDWTGGAFCTSDWQVKLIQIEYGSGYHEILMTPPQTTGQTVASFDVQFDGSYGIEQIGVGCEGGNDESIEFDDFNELFLTEPYVPPVITNALWGSSNGFWGSTTPLEISETLQASVQATGVDIYPLLKFVGIPMAFLIALYLIWLINKTLTPEKKKENIINPQGEEFIYHSADDLAFKNEYGKRKRGRPRKIL